MISKDQNDRNTDFPRQLSVTERSQWTLASFYECFLVSVAVVKSYSPCWEQHLQMPLALSECLVCLLSVSVWVSVAVEGSKVLRDGWWRCDEAPSVCARVYVGGMYAPVLLVSQAACLTTSSLSSVRFFVFFLYACHSLQCYRCVSISGICLFPANPSTPSPLWGSLSLRGGHTIPQRVARSSANADKQCKHNDGIQQKEERIHSYIHSDGFF